MKLEIYINRDWGLVVGPFFDNKPHKHYAIQITTTVNGNVFLCNPNTKTPVPDAIIIKPNVPHFIEATGNHLHLSINPNSEFGLYFNSIAAAPIHHFSNEFSKRLATATRQHLDGQFDTHRLTAMVNDILTAECAGFAQTLDDRIVNVFDHLHNNRDRWVPADECADKAHLSTSRFLHFFKEQTGSTFRRAQLWIRISHSMPMLQEKGLSATASSFGFFDKAHYCRAFKENLGFTPQLFIQQARLYYAPTN